MSVQTNSDKKDYQFGNFYLYWALSIAGWLFTTILRSAIAARNDMATMLSTIIVIPISIFLIVYYAILLYRIWKFVLIKVDEKGISRPIGSAGMAMGFLFIPLFNFYWIFYSFIKLVGTVNALAVKESLNRKISIALPITLGILTILGYIPVLNNVTTPLTGCVLYPLFFFLLIGTCREIHYKSQGIESAFNRVNLSEVRDFNQLFNIPKYGVNFQVGLAFMLAYLMNKIMLPLWYAFSYGIDDALSPRVMFVNLFFGALLGAVLVWICYLAKKTWAKILFFGIAGLVINFIGSSVTIFALGFYQPGTPIATFPMVIEFFLFSAAIMLALIYSVRYWGLKWWSLSAGLLIVSAPLFLVNLFIVQVPPEVVITNFVGFALYGIFLYLGFQFSVNNRIGKIRSASSKEFSSTNTPPPLPKKKSEQDSKPEFEVISQDDHGPEIEMDPQEITHAFVALLHQDVGHTSKVDQKIADLNRHCQPRIWDVSFRAKFLVFSCESMSDGYPDVISIPSALESTGCQKPYSIIVNMLTVTLDGGKTNSKILAGFAYPDNKPKIILPRPDGCKPI